VAASKTALITGISGQDGSYLAELLVGKGYRVIGTSRSDGTVPEIGSIELRRLDLGDTDAVAELVAALRPDEIYNVAARASSAQLFDAPLETADINGLATVRFLEAIRRYSPGTRFCQASSSEVFAGTRVSPQDESLDAAPVNSYGAAKAYGWHMVRMYRSRYGLHACTAILFNHESPRRAGHHVTRRISTGVAMIAAGQADRLELGSLDSRRDWSFAGDVVQAMWLMLQHATGDDYVVASGKTHSVRDFCRIAFECVGLDYEKYVTIDAAFGGRAETVELRGDPSRARRQLGWAPQMGFADMVRLIVDADLERLAAHARTRG